MDAITQVIDGFPVFALLGAGFRVSVRRSAISLWLSGLKSQRCASSPYWFWVQSPARRRKDSAGSSWASLNCGRFSQIFRVNWSMESARVSSR
ncbi:hypothetical protein [Rubritalea tangerina]|uniref:hypothetical protein n=1 Tax=Rubritalea tangerina TaxID=430798 RepID=UPI003616EB5D